MKSQNLQKENEIKKLILLLALGFALAACAAETPVPTPTLLPPTVSPMPPTVTPFPPTITSEPWDAKVHELAVGLHQLPHLSSHSMETLLGGTTVDLLAITEDQEWVQATAYLDGDSTITGWLQVDKLRLNVSLDDLTVDSETVFVPPPTSTPRPTRTPKPTEIPLGERYVNYLLEQGFEYYPDKHQYMKKAGRGLLLAAAQDGGQMVGYAIRVPITPMERSDVLAYLEEAGEFLDPGFGWGTILVAEDGMSQGFMSGTAWKNGRFVVYEIVRLDDTSIRVTFTFLNEEILDLSNE